MDKCERLTQLTFYGYNPKTKDCSIISNVPWIKSLEITNSSITNMNGLEKCYQLEEISFNYCSKLEKICCLEGSKHILNSLSFEHCKSIVNHDYVKKLDQLKLLTYKYSGAIKSIKFIKKISSLERFIFFGTDVIDGDLIPCISLIDAGFTNKKHFSHTMEQINRLQKERSITPFTR
jgi:protein phosphatase 1 regulatory subunit 7